MTDEFELSRRKALAGLATIGAAGAGAGLGTSALFSDEESFEENTITAGTLDMSVTASVEAANEYWAEQVDLAELEATADGEAVTGLQVEDVKPGDWGVICFDISVGDNPGYVQVTASDLTNDGNGLTEPEEEVDDEDGEGEGELQDEMIAEVYQTHVDEPDGDGPRDHVSGLDDSITEEGSTVQETYDVFEDGVTLREEDNETPLEVGSDDESASWCLLLYIPEDVGNVIQGDSFNFDLSFAAEQVRNNDDPFSGE